MERNKIERKKKETGKQEKTVKKQENERDIILKNKWSLTRVNIKRNPTATDGTQLHVQILNDEIRQTH